MFGTLDLNEIVEAQAHYWLGVIPAWNVFAQPLAFVLFLICIHAEANRAPFDMAEAEQELVGGYHTEYSSMRFALFFLSEYAGMITTSAVCVALFFGGWQPAVGRQADHAAGRRGRPAHPAVTTWWLANVVRFGVFFGKTVGRHLRLHVGPLEPAAVPVRPADDARLAGADPDLAGAAGGHGRGRVPVPQRPVRQRHAALALLGANVAVVLGAVVVSRVIPAAPPTNRRLAVAGSRFGVTPHPAGGNGTAAVGA